MVVGYAPGCGGFHCGVRMDFGPGAAAATAGGLEKFAVERILRLPKIGRAHV